MPETIIDHATGRTIAYVYDSDTPGTYNVFLPNGAEVARNVSRSDADRAVRWVIEDLT